VGLNVAFFTVQLKTYQPYTSKVRRYEDTKLLFASAAAGRRPAFRESASCKYKQPVIECCLYLQLVDSLTREARRGRRHISVRLAHWRQPGLIRVLFFVSSFLRFFDSSP